MDIKEYMSNRLRDLRKRSMVEDSADVGFASSYGQGSQITDAPDGGMTLSLVITTDAVDLDGDIVDPRGADWSYWNQRGLPVYLEHQYGICETVGKGRKDSLKMGAVAPGVTGWTIKVGLIKNELGLAVAAYVREFGQIGSSIGFRCLDSRTPTAEESNRIGLGGGRATRTITKWLGLENSLTCNPCNTLSGGYQTGEPAKMLNNLDRLVTKGLITKSAARALGLPEQRVIVVRNEQRRVVVE